MRASSRWRLFGLSTLPAVCTLTAASTGVSAATLPVPCLSGCGASAQGWVAAGSATATQVGSTLTVNQTSANATLNWQSFNISSDGTVKFVQPSTSALAINRIFQADPSQIFGSLSTNGRIYLINQNGILFGAGAQVNVGGLVASTLDLTPAALTNGIAGVSPDLPSPAFQAFRGADGSVISKPITIQQGASINAPGGEILIFAPQIDNQGTLRSPDGQTILAAGNTVLLATSTDPDIRGLIVAIDGGGTVNNGAPSNGSATDPTQLIGQIFADRGNVTLMGLAVNQRGLVSATTAVRANGTIKLVAGDDQGSGTVTLGPGSRTEAGLDTTDTSETVDATVQPKSSVDFVGHTIDVENGAGIVATSGEVTLAAVEQTGLDSEVNPSAPLSSTSDGSRVYIAPGASIDVSGASATLPMSSNVLQVQLRGSELADDPLQRNGPLRGATVNVDVRQYGTLPDGTQWEGTPLADLSGDVATIQRGVAERNLTGGTVTVQSQGDVIVAPGASVNTSGGTLTYQGGMVNTSVLIGADGQLYDISNASPTQVYQGVANTSSISMLDQRWGVTQVYNGIFGTGQGHYEQGYVQGADAGSLSIVAPNVVFDGRYVANVTVGPYQRNPAPGPLPAGTVLRPYDQIPLSGELQVGPVVTVPPGAFQPPDVIESSISFSATPVLPGMRNADGSPFDPLTDPWPASVTGISLDPALIGAGEAGRVELSANGAITVPSNLAWQLPPGGSLSLTGGSVDMAGHITGNDASVSISTLPTFTTVVGKGGIALENSAQIDVSGAWVNDSPALNPVAAVNPIATAGGSVSISARDGSVTLSPGSIIDVSGGAQLAASGALVGGSAGQISLSASSPDLLTPEQLSLGSALRGYALSGGGTLALGAGSVCIQGAGPCASANSAGALDLGPATFSSGGFSSYSITANAGSLELAAGTQVHPVLQNWIAGPGLAGQRSSAGLAGLVTVGVLDDLHRAPVNVALSSSLGTTNTISPDIFAVANADLVLASGAAINLDPLASLTLTSDTRILDDAIISAPDGDVSMTLKGSLNEVSYIPGHKIWLGSDAVIDLRGAVQAAPDDLGLVTGSVLPGGSVSLTAQRGAVELLPGSQIDVSGASGTLDVPQVSVTGSTVYESRTVASAGGSITITAAEAALLSGTLLAKAGDPTTVPGGTFSLTLDPNNRYQGADFNGYTLPVFPYGAREIDVAQMQAPVAVGALTDLPDEYEGRALVSADMLQNAGFASVALQSASLDSTAGPPLVGGRLVFNGNVSLSVPQRLELDAAQFASDGGRASLSASYVSIGNSRRQAQQLGGSAVTGNGSLSIEAQQIDLVGAATYDRFDQVTLDSHGDIRAIGVQVPQVLALTGAMTVSGSLALDAQQIYPATLVQFAFTAGAANPNPAESTSSIRISDTYGTAASPPLSAAGTLSFNAPLIVQGGVVRAPIGTLSFLANQITLAAGSTTSTSASGLTIPFGETQGGFDWTYPLTQQPSGGTLVYGTDGAPVPAQSINLSGTSVDIAKGAVLDVSGGGDLLATEFIPGPTGTQDVLAANASSLPGAFAIVPTLGSQYAPYDRYYWDGSALQPGDSIYLSGGGGVPAGTYAMLPARYALLPGAYLVTPASAATQNLSLGQSIAQSDGSTIVAGYRVFAGTKIGGALTSGFDLLPGSAISTTFAQYTSTSADTFFTNQAATSDVDPTRLPRDAGTIVLSAVSSLVLDGTLDATVGSPSARGAAVDITSEAIRVVDGAAPPSPQPNTLDIDANSLDALGAESILLGGTRSEGDQGLTIDAQASSVEVSGGAKLAAPELLLVGTNSVTVDASATVSASGSLPTSDSAILVQGDGGLLRVAASGSPVITRSASGGSQGQVNVANGAVVGSAGASVSVDSSSSATLDGTFAVSGGALAISGSELSLGDAPAGTPGIVLPSQILSAVSPNTLSLSSRSTIDVYDGAALSGGDVSLRATALRGFGSSDTTVTASGMLTLAGPAASGAGSSGAVSASDAGADVGIGTGHLTLQGASIALGGGDLAVSGFSSTALSTDGTLTFSGTGSLTVAGNLSISAAQLTGKSGAEQSVTATGTFSYDASAGSAPPVSGSLDALGASFSASAQSIEFNGAALLHSGLLSLTATGQQGNVDFGAQTEIDLSGTNTTFDSVAVPSGGGTLSVQSESGSITAAAGSQIDVSAPDSAATDAGRISLAAPAGAIELSGGLKGNGADFIADALSLPNLAALEATLGSGGFTGERSLRLRGPGDLVIGASSAEAITARSVQLEADQGQVVIDGSIRSSDSLGGSVVVSARDDVVVNGSIDVRPDSASDQNGNIELETTQGGVLIGASATLAAYDPSVAVQSETDGALLIRAPQTSLNAAALGGQNDHFALDGNLQNLRAISIEGFKAYTYAGGTIGVADTTPDAALNPLYADAATFMASAPAIIQALGPIRGPTPTIVPGIEIDAPGDLTLSSSWALDGWRFGGVPGVLTLRAGGNLNIDASLSDGFSGTAGAQAYVLTSQNPSWSFRLTAGADLSASSPLAVQTGGQIAASSGTLTVAGGTPGNGRQPPAMTMIRTGTGSIEIATAQDVVLTNSESVIYTAGVASSGVVFAGRGQLAGLLYPTEGGDISISAGRDVVGAPNSTELVNDWLWRVGSNAGRTPATAWTVNFADFEQDIGALGGGNVAVSAGRDLVDVSVNVPTVGRQVGGTTLAQNDVQIIDGGNISLRAGRDMAGGNLYDGQGSASVVVGNSIRDSLTRAGLYPVIGLGNATATLSARNGLTLGAVYNPTLLPQGTSQGASQGLNTSFFTTYGASSGLIGRTLAGNARLINDTSAQGILRNSYDLPFPSSPDESSGLAIYPGTLELDALRGDLQIDDTMTLYPQPTGRLDLFASGSVDLGSASGSQFELIQSDADSSLLPSVDAPQGNYLSVLNLLSTLLNGVNFAGVHAPTPVYLQGPTPDSQPARIVALSGDVTMDSPAAAQLSFAEPAHIIAGQDVVQLGVDFQNLLPTDVSAVVAGRDITYQQARDATGELLNLAVNRQIAIDGPGTLEVWAGANINLQTAGGISSRGSLLNASLPAQGADVSVAAGIGGTGVPDFSSFIKQYLSSSSDYASELVSYMTPLLGGTPSADQALQAFETLSPFDQAPLIEAIFFDELRQSGRAAAQPGAGHDDFAQGFAAIETLFPGGNPDPSKGETNPYSGDISLYFSRIYTLAGGNINLLAPGGQIDAGLATPPQSLGVTKSPSELGIVAQSTGSVSGYSYSDFSVNESRVFAADGGDILIWSSRGNIDAGRGAKTAISAPAPTVTFKDGVPVVTFPAALQGSGIQTLATSPGVSPGDVDLFAPHGVVNANDAGIVAGNLTIAATAVLGANNIKVSGISIGVPVEASGLGLSVAAVSSVANSASQAATQEVWQPAERETAAPVAEAALSWLDVFIEGFGKDVCQPSDLECLKRQQTQ